MKLAESVSVMASLGDRAIPASQEDPSWKQWQCDDWLELLEIDAWINGEERAAG
jgi:hypothetical protein